VRITTFQANTHFAWFPVRLCELVDGYYQWAWLERVECISSTGKPKQYRRIGITATPLELGRNAEKVASGQLVVRPGW
jgi:hypothetical protein